MQNLKIPDLINKFSWNCSTNKKNIWRPILPCNQAFNHLAFGSTKLIKWIGDKIFCPPRLFNVTISNIAFIISLMWVGGYLKKKNWDLKNSFHFTSFLSEIYGKNMICHACLEKSMYIPVPKSRQILASLNDESAYLQ